MKAALAFVALFSLVACSDDNPGMPIDAPDAPIDASFDTLPGCGGDITFTGEYVDWDSTVASFQGIFEARFTVVPIASRTALTAPNGRVTLCLTDGATVRVTATHPMYTPAVFLADPRVFTPVGSVFSARGLAVADRDAHYGALMTGMTYDDERAHVLVDTRGTASPITLSSGTPSYAYNAEAWALGNTGAQVFFPNVPVGTGVATLGGPFVGPNQIELVADQLTVVPVR